MPSRFAQLFGSRAVSAESTVADLRRYYDGLAERYGEAPADTAIEPARIGQMVGEWVSVEETAPHRLILYFHGGGYISGSSATSRPLVARLCKAAGAVALSLDYRLGPEFPFPAALRDAVDAYRALMSRGFEPETIALAGEGSGGGLAFATLLAIRNARLPMPAACVAMSPWADLSLSGWSMMKNERNDAILSRELLFVSARHYLQDANPADPYASPVYGHFRDFPPIMVHAGSLEVLRDDASRLGELAAAAHSRMSVEIYDGMRHVFQADWTLPMSKVSLSRMGHFVKSHTPERPVKVDLGRTASQRRSLP